MSKASVACVIGVFLLIVSVNGDKVTANATCGIPPDIEEATTPDLDDAEHAVGTVINYQCDLGYVSRNSRYFPSTCEINETTGKAEWTKPEISCSPRSCGDPGYVTNGRRIGNLFTFPNGIEFECDEGYKLKGLKSRYCQVNGEWSGRRLPTCELINCTTPSNPVNGRVSYSSLGYGSKLRYECNWGFVLKNHETRICGNNGKWSNKEPECIEVTCEEPPPPERGSVRFPDGLAVGSHAIYSCEEGATLVGVESIKCLENRIWLFDPPKCLQNSCTAPANPMNGRVSYSSLGYGSELRYECNTGFVLKKPVTRVCKSNGEWSNREPECIVECSGPPPALENGSPVDIKRIHGSVIKYECKDGFSKLWNGNVTCVHGTWRGQPPVCEHPRCSKDKLNFAGLQKEGYRASYEDGHLLHIACEAGYQKNDEAELRCSKGDWDANAPPCEPPGRCDINEFTYTYHISREETPRYVDCGQDLHVTCKAGYSPTLVKPHCLFGKWTKNARSPCREDGCLVPKIENGHMVDNSKTVPFGALASPATFYYLHCDSGYSFQGAPETKRRITCTKAHWSPKPVCIRPRGRT